jgi:hypothetical protein
VKVKLLITLAENQYVTEAKNQNAEIFAPILLVSDFAGINLALERIFAIRPVATLSVNLKTVVLAIPAIGLKLLRNNKSY